VSLSANLQIPFRVLLREDDQTIATYFELLDEQAERMNRGR
jgi:hypothetical protein